MESPIIVSGRGPARLRTLLLAAAVLAALASWGFFEWGRRAGGYDALESIKAREHLAEQIMELESRNKDLRREIALMKAAGRVDREAYGRVSREIGDLESQVAELNEELAFYRDVMSPTDGDSELQVPEGGTLTLTYRDMENLDPGIPADRSVTIEHAKYVTPQLGAYTTSSKLLPVPKPTEESY